MWTDEAGLSLNWNTPDVLYQMNEGRETLLFKEILDILNRIVKKIKEDPDAINVNWIEKTK
ncbi:hypothetical protein [Succinatimonas hippei]|uniref:hypothetical protein n=1 Tax=Succinatimonas hippei TaxID=626938 RepID=UPI0023F65B3D|nr:hypothetical protein [Succinatimonas hippei]